MSAAAPIRVPGAQGTPAWLDNRRDVIGSSDIPVITGSSPYRTSLVDLWAVKTRELEPAPDDPEDEERYWWGHALEEPIAQRYAIATGRKVRRGHSDHGRFDGEFQLVAVQVIPVRDGEARLGGPVVEQTGREPERLLGRQQFRVGASRARRRRAAGGRSERAPLSAPPFRQRSSRGNGAGHGRLEPR